VSKTKQYLMDIDAIYKALANPIRCQILHWLKTPERFFSEQEHPLSMGVCATSIGQRTGLSQSTVSVHLKILTRCGLLTSQRIGQWTFLQRDAHAVRAFTDYLGNNL
jgi:DNA-binding transcriptional ArsR family regulator